MKFNLDFIAGVGYIAFMVGLAWGQVGELPGPPEPYPWWLPLVMLGVCGFPFGVGYFAGKGGEEKNDR